MRMFVAGLRRHTMRVRLGEAAMVPDDFRSTDTVRFPTCLDGLRKHFLDITRVLDATDIDFRCHGIRGTEMNATDTAKALIEVLLERDVPDTVQLNLVFAQIKAATLDDEFGLGQGVLIYRTIISVRHSHSLARGNCAQNETAMAALQCLVVVYRYADIVRAYPFF